MDKQDGIDIGFLHAARRLADKGWGRVHPNPLVGAVVVVDNEIVGKGYHAEFGGPHGEVAALRDAGEKARGATLYVTLEPCAHHGKTPPCTDAIIAAGIKRVVFGARDPHKQAAGGAEVLRQAGIEVKGGVEEKFIRTQNAPFFRMHERGGCFVALKLAMSLDARLTRDHGKREQVTGDVANQEVHRLRSGFDGIMVGINTVRIDDPLLTVRLTPPSIRPPARIVVDTHATLSTSSRLVQTIDQAPVVVISGETADTRALASAGVRVIAVPIKSGHVDLRAALEQLAAEGIHSLLCEGGARLGTVLLEQDLVDRIYTFIAPDLFGSAGLAAFPLKNPLPAGRFELQRIAKTGSDALLMLDRCLPA